MALIRHIEEVRKLAMSASKAKRTNYGKSVSHTKLAVVAQRGQLWQTRRVRVSRRSQLGPFSRSQLLVNQHGPAPLA